MAPSLRHPWLRCVRTGVTASGARRRQLVHRGDLPADHGVLIAADLTGEPDQPVDRLLEAGDALDPEPGPFVRERTLRDGPAAIQSAHQVGTWHNHVGEEHFGKAG